MGKLREEGVGIDARWRRRTNRLPLVMVGVFIVVLALIVLVSVSDVLDIGRSHSGEKLDAKNAGSSTWRDPRLAGGDHDPYTPVLPNAHSSSGWSRQWVSMLPGAVKDESFFCQRYHKRTDVCRMHGIVQMDGKASFKLHAMYEATAVGEMKLKPYTRKWEALVMDNVRELTLRSERSVGDGNVSRVCEEWHTVPAVVFSSGGYTGNVYHEFNDGLIPLYITTQHLRGEVMLLISDYHGWWTVKYQEILKRLSKYDIIDIANTTRKHCFLDVTAGLFIHDELGIDRSLMPERNSIQDFRALLDEVYPLENSGWEQDFPTYEPAGRPESRAFGAAPRLVIIKREGSRTIMNLDEVIETALGLGFVVSILQPDPTTEMKKMFWLLDRCDVLIGVHGAALTHFLFMRPGTVFIQVVPLGTNWAARAYYGDPAKRLGLHYIEYKIAIQESSLSREYEKNDPVLLDPDAVIAQGWAVIKEVYLGRQNVELHLPRFKRVLESARARWRSDPAPMGSTLRPEAYKRHRAPPKGDLGIASASRGSSFGSENSGQRHSRIVAL